jgi:hypothetical protein
MFDKELGAMFGAMNELLDYLPIVFGGLLLFFSVATLLVTRFQRLVDTMGVVDRVTETTRRERERLVTISPYLSRPRFHSPLTPLSALNPIHSTVSVPHPAKY